MLTTLDTKGLDTKNSRTRASQGLTSTQSARTMPKRAAMRTIPLVITVWTLAWLNAPMASAFSILDHWRDGRDIVIDNLFSGDFSSQAILQMNEWNEVDTDDNSHAFRLSSNPQSTFGANDGDNTIGFLEPSVLSSEYGLSYTGGASAFTVCFNNFLTGNINECDVMLDPSIDWSTDPAWSGWFQAELLTQLGKVRGLRSYDGFLSTQNTRGSDLIRGETLYMDDKFGVRQNASHVSERDITIYNKFHDGTSPQWMSMSPLVLREGDTLSVENLTVENRGTVSFDSSVAVKMYLSEDRDITTADMEIASGSFPSFGTFGFSTFDWSAVIPTVEDCAQYFVGAIVDPGNSWSERFEDNNVTVFTDGGPFGGENDTNIPTPINIFLAEDDYEPNNSLAAASQIPLPFFSQDLNLDNHFEVDYYQLFVPVKTGGPLHVLLTFEHARGDLKLEVLNGSGQVLASSDTMTDNEFVSVSVKGGTHYIRVSGKPHDECNRYGLSVRLMP